MTIVGTLTFVLFVVGLNYFATKDAAQPLTATQKAITAEHAESAESRLI